jgi:hypothetical protein
MLMRAPPIEDQIIELVAFLGRYCSQPAEQVLRMTRGFASKLANATATMMKAEQPAAHGEG